MLELNKYNSQKVGILGLGKTGQASAIALLMNQALIVVWDDDQSKRTEWLINISKRFDQLTAINSLIDPYNYPSKWQLITSLILSPGIDLTSHFLYKFVNTYKIRVISDIEVLYEHYPFVNYIGITGTNGKSTTTCLINHLLTNSHKLTAMGGNIGVPVLELTALDRDNYYIIELSSYQLTLLKQVKINIAILLNISPDHLEYHQTLANYIEAKKKIFNHQTPLEIAIINIDNEFTKMIFDQLALSDHSPNLIPISTKIILAYGVSIINKILYLNIKEQLVIDLNNLTTLMGDHNDQNIAASIAAAISCGINIKEITQSLASFQPLAHRQQLVAIINNINYINDSKATNADSTGFALKTYDNIYWILGGLPKTDGIDSLTIFFNKIKHAFIIGKATDQFAELFDKYQVAYTKCYDLESAVKLANKLAKLDLTFNNISILFSPACASFDQYSNFMIRGEHFCSLVRELNHE